MASESGSATSEPPWENNTVYKHFAKDKKIDRALFESLYLNHYRVSQDGYHFELEPLVILTLAIIAVLQARTHSNLRPEDYPLSFTFDHIVTEFGEMCHDYHGVAHVFFHRIGAAYNSSYWGCAFLEWNPAHTKKRGAPETDRRNNILAEIYTLLRRVPLPDYVARHAEAAKDMLIFRIGMVPIKAQQLLDQSLTDLRAKRSSNNQLMHSLKNSLLNSYIRDTPYLNTSVLTHAAKWMDRQDPEFSIKLINYIETEILEKTKTFYNDNQHQLTQVQHRDEVNDRFILMELQTLEGQTPSVVETARWYLWRSNDSPTNSESSRRLLESEYHRNNGVVFEGLVNWLSKTLDWGPEKVRTWWEAHRHDLDLRKQYSHLQGDLCYPPGKGQGAAPFATPEQQSWLLKQYSTDQVHDYQFFVGLSRLKPRPAEWGATDIQFWFAMNSALHGHHRFESTTQQAQASRSAELEFPTVPGAASSYVLPQDHSSGSFRQPVHGMQRMSAHGQNQAVPPSSSQYAPQEGFSTHGLQGRKRPAGTPPPRR